MLQICRNEEIYVASFAKKCTSKLFAHNDRTLEMVREHGKLVTKTPNNNTFFLHFLLLVRHLAQALTKEVAEQKWVRI